VDGSLGSTTALFYEPYKDAPRTSGLLVTPEDSLRSWIGSADSAGLQVAIHAIGDRANGLLLDIYDSVGKAHGSRDRRFRVEHAQHLRRQDIDRIARLGVIASMQPYHAVDDGRWAEKRIGPERIKTTYAFRSLIDAGKVKSLVILDEKPSSLYPKVQTGADAIGTRWQMGAWRGIGAPKNLPKAIEARLQAAVKKAYESKEFEEFMTQRGFGMRWAGPSDFATFMAEEDKKMGVVMNAVGLTK
jgi:hypothetical protein